MHERKRKMPWILGIAVLFGLIVMAIVITYKHEHKYLGNGIPYITAEGKTCQLQIFNSNGVYKETLGAKDEIFWFASTLYEDETLSVDNHDTIYSFSSQEINRYQNVQSNIMAVLKVDKFYLIISQVNTSVNLEVYSEGFIEKLDAQSVQGTFDYYFIEGEKVYYSVHGEEEAFTNIYMYDLEIASNECVYSYDENMEIYPFIFEEKLYLAKNKLITELGNIDILEICKIEDNGERNKTLQLNEPLRKVIVVNNEVYGLTGVNSTEVVKWNLLNNTQEILFALNDEAALGIYYMDNRMCVLTNCGIYYIEENQIIKQHDIFEMELMNVFY